MPKCLICGKELENPDSLSHINSKFHQNALKKLNDLKDIPKKSNQKEIVSQNSLMAQSESQLISSSQGTKRTNKSFQIIKIKIYTLLNLTRFSDLPSTLLSILFIITSLASGFTILFETVDYIQNDYFLVLKTIEIIALCIFSVELILRVWICDINPKYKDVKFKRLKYMFNFLPMVDLFSVVSIFLGLVISMDNPQRGWVRILHLIVFFKLVRYSQSFDVIFSVIKDKKEELLITFMLSMLLMFLGSVLVFLAEHDAQPTVFTNLFSSMWFTAINLFTIGYGEIVPVTTMGKLVSSVISVMGITLFLLPASVIGSGFVDEIQSRNPQFEACPNCHKVIDRNQLLRDLFAKTKGRKPKIITQALEEVEKTQESPEDDIFIIQKMFFQNLEFRYPRNLLQFFIFVFFSTLITLNVLAIMAETNPILYQENRIVIFVVLLISVAAFTIEYILRIWSVVASDDKKYQDPKLGRLNYMRSFLGVMDLIYLIALYLTVLLFFAFPMGIPILLALRMFVVFQIGHFLAVFDVIGSIVKYSKKEFFTTLLLCVLFLIIASTVIYHLEKDAQPEKFKNIPATLWFGVITFTTTGFGDIYPITTAGRLATICFAFLGVSLFTLPAGILGASFFNSMKEFRMYLICPKCGYIMAKPKLRKE